MNDTTATPTTNDPFALVDESRHADDADGGIIARYDDVVEALTALRGSGYFPLNIAPRSLPVFRDALAVFGDYDGDTGPCDTCPEYVADIDDAIDASDRADAYAALQDYAEHLYTDHVHPAALEAAGWERCYHREGANYHYNVKTCRGRAWQGFADAIRAAETEYAAAGRAFREERVRELADTADDANREFWWYDTLPDAIADVAGYTRGDGAPRVWACGRSGGYVNVPDIETDAAGMVRLAGWLAGEVEYFTSYNAGRDAAEYALALYASEGDEDANAAIIAAYAAGVTEYRASVTSAYDTDAETTAYDAGREAAHVLTHRRYDASE